MTVKEIATLLLKNSSYQEHPQYDEYYDTLVSVLSSEGDEDISTDINQLALLVIDGVEQFFLAKLNEQSDLNKSLTDDLNKIRKIINPLDLEVVL